MDSTLDQSKIDFITATLVVTVKNKQILDAYDVLTMDPKNSFFTISDIVL